MAAARPLLWQLAISPYSEKVRWALGYKGIAHDRRTPAPGLHMAVALWLTGGRGPTLPVMELDGRTVGDSTAIIAALEERQPDPPLYPSDPVPRARALALEDWFDEHAGSDARRLFFHDLGREPALLDQAVKTAVPDLRATLGPAATAYAWVFTKVRYGTHPEGLAERAREGLVAAFDRIEAELGDGEYLVGDRFSVADLTAAALLFPVVLPPQAPQLEAAVPEPYERFRASVRNRRGYSWVEEMYARHYRAAVPVG